MLTVCVGDGCVCNKQAFAHSSHHDRKGKAITMSLRSLLGALPKSVLAVVSVAVQVAAAASARRCYLLSRSSSCFAFRANLFLLTACTPETLTETEASL